MGWHGWCILQSPPWGIQPDGPGGFLVHSLASMRLLLHQCCGRRFIRNKCVGCGSERCSRSSGGCSCQTGVCGSTRAGSDLGAETVAAHPPGARVYR